MIVEGDIGGVKCAESELEVGGHVVEVHRFTSMDPQGPWLK